MTDTPAQNGSAVPAPDTKAPSNRRTMIIWGLLGLAAIAAIGGTFYWLSQQKYVYTDKATIQAPLIKLAPHAPGELKKVLIDQGDMLTANQTVARVGDEMLLTQVPGLAVIVQKDLGTIYQPGSPVVTMIQPAELRVVAQIEEDKGLQYIHVGQDVTFKVDAFGGKIYNGTVESVSQTSRSGDVVFNISDSRQEQQFDVKIQYDVNTYPELQNGMSARVWIIK
jgi:multidrug resistance efflux pump